MKTEVISTDMLITMSKQGKNWRYSQPEHLKKIEQLTINLTKIIHRYGESEKQEYVNQTCNEIKQLAHDYQAKIGYMR